MWSAHEFPVGDGPLCSRQWFYFKLVFQQSEPLSINRVDHMLTLPIAHGRSKEPNFQGRPGPGFSRRGRVRELALQKFGTPLKFAELNHTRLFCLLAVQL